MVTVRALVQLSAGVALCLAQSSVVTLRIPPVDRGVVFASIASADATATEYVLGCPAGQDASASECLLAYNPTVKVGATAFTLHLTATSAETTGGAVTSMEYSALGTCVYLTDKPSAACSASGTILRVVNGTSSTTSTQTGSSNAPVTNVPVTITAGLEKLSAATSTASSTTLRPTGTLGSQPLPSGTGTGASAPTSTSTSTAGVPKATRNAVLAGLVVVAGGVLMV